MNNLFRKPFKATSKAYDITSVNYNLLGLHKKEYFDSNGDLNKLEMYTNYDQQADIYTGLAILEERTYLRDASTGLLKTRTTNITWYDIDGNVNTTKSNVTKFFSAKKGFVANKRARQNIIDKASMYLYQELMITNLGDKNVTDLQIDNFETLTSIEQGSYIKSNTTPLISLITNSTDNAKDEYRDYITPSVQAVLLSILNVSYAG